jgi:hemolysin III
MAPATGWKDLLQRLDHAETFLKIAGTDTPFAVLKRGAGGLAMLGSVWLVALFGGAGKLLLVSTWDRLALCSICSWD